MRLHLLRLAVPLLCILPLAAPADPAVTGPADSVVAAAAHDGQSGILRRLLQQGGNVRATDSRGFPLIALAVLAKDPDTVQVLLDADPSLANTSYVDTAKVRRTPLIASVFMRDPATTALLLKAGADVHAIDGADVNPLLAAAYTGNLEIGKLLLDAGLEPNARDHSGTSPLALAASAGQVDFAKLLLERGAWTYPLDAWGKNAVAHATADIKDPEVAKAMLALLAEHHAPTTNSNRPVDVEYLEAVHRGDLTAVKAALANGADVNARRILTLDNGLCEALSLAVPNLPLMTYLLDHGVDAQATSQAGFTALHMASGRGGSPQSVELLVKRGLDINQKSKSGFTALYNAVNQDVPATVELLIKLGADGKVSGPAGTNLLDLARQGKRSPRIAAALEHAGAVPGGPDTPAPCALTATPIPPCAMLISAQLGNVDRIRKGLDAGLDPNLRDPVSGNSLLEVALALPAAAASSPSDPDARRDAAKIEIARLLIDRGVDVTHPDRTGTTPLHRAAGDARLSALVAPLLAKGARVNAATTEKQITPLMIAVAKGNLPVVEQLLAAGADANLAMARGVTPLMAAASAQSAALSAALLAHGARLEVVSEIGITPLKAAVQSGHADVVDLLLKAGANADNDGGHPPAPRGMAIQDPAIQALIRAATPAR